MKFKIKKILSPRQVLKAKFSVFMASVVCVFILGSSYLGVDGLEYNGEEYVSTKTDEFERGKIVYFGNNVEVCDR